MYKVRYYIIILTISFVGCKKEIFDSSNNTGGCTDLNAINYSNNVDFEDNSCQYAYINQYEVSYYPENNPNSSIPFVNSWDIPGTGADADLLLKVKFKDSSNYLFSSPILDDQSPNSAAYWTAPVEFKLLNMDYKWELYDNDVTNSNEFIDSGSFNPVEIASNFKITVYGKNPPVNRTQLVLHYQLSD